MAYSRKRKQIPSSFASKYSTVVVGLPKPQSQGLFLLTWARLRIHKNFFTHCHQIAQILPEGKVRNLLHALCSHNEALVEEPTNDVDCNQ